MSTVRAPLTTRSANAPHVRPRPWHPKGSDESMPSAPGAIPDAFRKSSPLSAEPIIMAGPTLQPAFTTLARWSHVNLQRDSPLTRLETTPFIYGHGTALDPITEQRSLATLRTTQSSSTASDLSSLLSRPQPSSRWRRRRQQQQQQPPPPPPQQQSPNKQLLRHRRSFRGDDLGPLGRLGRSDVVPEPAAVTGTVDGAVPPEEEEEDEPYPAFCSREDPTAPPRRLPAPPGQAGGQSSGTRGVGDGDAHLGERPYPRHPGRPTSPAWRECKVCRQPAGQADGEGRPRRACSRCVARKLALRVVCCDVR